MKEALADFCLPSSTTVIDRYAFTGLKDMGKVTLPANLSRIRSKAFSRCAIEEINLPGSLISIANDAFDQSTVSIIRVPYGTYAWNWAFNNKLALGEIIPSFPTGSGRVKVISSSASTYSGPGTNYTLISKSYLGETLSYTAIVNGWYRLINGCYLYTSDAQDITSFDISSSGSGSYRYGDDGEMVSWIQRALTALNYYNDDVSGLYDAQTEDAIRAFQAAHALESDGIANAITIEVLQSALNDGFSTQEPSEIQYNPVVYDLDWFNAKASPDLFKTLGFVSKSNDCYLIDLETGTKINLHIHSASSHLDAEPLTASDTSRMCSLWKVPSASSISYMRRPMLIVTKDNRQILCSVYGTPHGTQDISSNNFPGYFCIHFLNSTTSSNVVSNYAVAALAQARTKVAAAGKAMETLGSVSPIPSDSPVPAYGDEITLEAYAKTSADTTVLRKNPDPSSGILCVLPFGSVMKIDKQITSGSSIWYHGTAFQGGYAYSGVLPAESSIQITRDEYTALLRTATLSDNEIDGMIKPLSDSTAVRLGPGTEYDIAYSVDSCDVLPYVQVSGGWYRLLDQNYIDSQLVLRVSDSEIGQYYADPESYRYGDSGDMVGWIQNALLTLGYYSANVSNLYDEQTENAVKSFQSSHHLTADGIADSATMDALRADLLNASAGIPFNSVVYDLDWFNGKATPDLFKMLGILAKNNSCSLIDLQTGTKFNIHIQSAGSHVDAEPLTASDTNKMCSLWGVSSASGINYLRRPMLFVAQNNWQIICSVYGTPHGSQDITSNNFPGQFCIHFRNSTTNQTRVVSSYAVAALAHARALVFNSGGTLTSLSGNIPTPASSSSPAPIEGAVSIEAYARMDASNTVLRATPEASGNQICIIATGSFMQIDSQVNQEDQVWYHASVHQNGATFVGYVPAELVTTISYDEYLSGISNGSETGSSNNGMIKITSGSASIRKGPGTEYDIMYTAYNGETFYFSSCSDGWYHLLNGYYVSSSDASFVSTTVSAIDDDEIDGIIKVTSENTAVREGPGEEYSIAYRASEGDTVFYIGISGGWYHLLNGCYISSADVQRIKDSEIAPYYGRLQLYQYGDTGDMVSWIQRTLNALGYFYGSISGHYDAQTEEAVNSFQASCGLPSDGIADDKTIAALQNALSGGSESSSVSFNNIVYDLDWFRAKASGSFINYGIIHNSNDCALIDLQTGTRINIHIQSAGNHLDAEPLTESDTDRLSNLWDVSLSENISYLRRPMLFVTKDNKQIICSVYGVPHGEQDITSNKYPGHLCIHFLNSTTSGTRVVNAYAVTALNMARAMVMSAGKTLSTAP